MRADIRAFFGSYRKAPRLGRELLYAVGQQQAINEEIVQAKVGKLTPDSLYVHVTAVSLLQCYSVSLKDVHGPFSGTCSRDVRETAAGQAQSVLPLLSNVRY